MKNVCISVAAVAAMLALVGGCSKNEDATSTTRTTSANAPATPATLPPVSSDDQAFFAKAAQGSLLEVQLGQQVMSKAQAPEVKELGDLMISDHTRANEELKQLATKKGLTLPTELDKDHRKTLDDMSKLSGVKLDKEYASDMIDDHEEDVKEFKKAAADVKDPELRAWAEKTLPALEHHLAMAKDVKTRIKDEK